MTAHDLIDSIFSRPQQSVAGNIRYISEDQRKFLTDLIGQDSEGGSVTRGAGGSLVWVPSGRHKYVLTENVTIGRKPHTLMRLSNIIASETGRLF
jgi:hypothetical protein